MARGAEALERPTYSRLLRFQRFPARELLRELALQLVGELPVGLDLLAALLVIVGRCSCAR